jgi:hypothetical protein
MRNPRFGGILDPALFATGRDMFNVLGRLRGARFLCKLREFRRDDSVLTESGRRWCSEISIGGVGSEPDQIEPLYNLLLNCDLPAHNILKEKFE